MLAAACRCLFLLFLLFSGYGFNVVAAEPPAPLILGIHPYLPEAELQERFQPLANYIGKALGRNITIRVGRDYDEHIKAVRDNIVDIAYMGPYLYVIVANKYGSKPPLVRIAVDGKPELYGAIVVRNDSPYKDISDLKGRSFAFGDAYSTMSHIVPESMLRQAGIPLSALSDHKFLGAHKNVALGVLSGDFDAGAVKMEVYEEYAPRGLRLLAKSPAISEHVLVTRSDMPAKQVATLRQALLDLSKQPEGKQIMKSIHKGMTAFVPATDSDYDSLRKLMRTSESTP